MEGADVGEDISFEDPSSRFPYLGPSVTYQRPSPVRQRLQAPSQPQVTSPVSSHEDGHSGWKSTADVPDTQLPSSDKAGLIIRGYERLRRGEIRLLHLSPSGDANTPIAGSLSNFKLETSPSYTAISYAWGDRRSLANIRIDGNTTLVTRSLKQALTSLRREDQPVLIWVDALSINQHDVVELNHQVQIMDSIYRQAETVAVCLGPHSENENSKAAFDYLREISKTKGSALTDWTSSAKQILPIVHLFERNYWKRLWVMQEVFHANRVEVYCGSDSIPLETISAACEVFKSVSRRIENSFPGGTVINTSGSYYSYAQTLTTQGPNTLLDSSTNLSERPLEILRISRIKLAARPQDKILGVLSLLSQDIRSIFRPDFQLTPQEVFSKVFYCIFKTSGSLDILCESIRYPFHQNSFGLPSWVPDWSHSPDTLSLAATHLSHRRPFQACSTAMMSEFSTKQPVFRGNELQIHGIQIGTIEARGMAVGTLGRLTNYLMAFLEWRHLLLNNDRYSQNYQVPFCRTLCLGDIPEDVSQTLEHDYGVTEFTGDSINEEAMGSENRRLVQWKGITLDVFAGLLGERLGKLPLDDELKSHQNKGRKFRKGRQFLQEYFADRMMGRCFCLLGGKHEKGYMGMGTGFMGIGDLVVVAYGCSAPIVIRPMNQEGKYEFIGDIYVDECMDGHDADLRFHGTEKEFILC